VCDSVARKHPEQGNPETGGGLLGARAGEGWKIEG
jgi:hypothetical protein